MPLYINKSDSYLMVHLGHGDVTIATSKDGQEVIIMPQDVPGVVGQPNNHEEGKPTNTLNPGIRICTDNPASLDILIEELQKVRSEWKPYAAQVEGR